MTNVNHGPENGKALGVSNIGTPNMWIGFWGIVNRGYEDILVVRIQTP